jgi:16S rRNA (cytosine1402-N4)-methyltransferase
LIVPESAEHRPVLFQEAVAALNIAPGDRCVDGTFGRGGHSGAILGLLGRQGALLAIDKDPDAVAFGRERFGADPRFHIEQGSFGMLKRFTDHRAWTGAVNSLLLDLGVSSPQLDRPERGFSFMEEGPLDMRMDNSTGMTAARWLTEAEAGEIIRVLKAYGEERFARRIATAILTAREREPIDTTARLAEIITAAVPVREKGRHPATRSFQAIRIHINRELEDLRDGLDQALEVLTIGGRLVVISFHSLEDRIVKRFIRDHRRGDRFPPGVPVTQTQLCPRLKGIGKVLRSSPEEVRENPRARSAVLRVAERLA